MPSASAKLEKQASTESHDPIKHVLSMVEKKVRNLEKRKGKLDNYRMDFNNGKELNEDQMNAIKKYEQVVEVLDFSKDMQKSIQVIIQECAKQQKKAAKREQMERQQQEMHRLREIMQLQDLLNNMGTDDVRQDFLTGSQGAVKLSQQDLDRLDELFKLVSPDRDCAKGDFESQLTSAAEHLINLLDGRNKELMGGTTTYKSMKELLTKINNSEYFSRDTKEEDIVVPDEAVSEVKESSPEEFTDIPQQIQVESGGALYAGEPVPSAYVGQPPLPEVLHVQGNFNFLQDSQVDVESGRTPSASLASYPTSNAHMDPAVVAAQPMAGYHPAVAGAAEEFDPVGPIPTQTFTNQSYAMMGIPQASYVAPQTLGLPSVPQPVATPQQQDHDAPTFMSVQDYQGTLASNSTQPQSTTTQYQSSDENEEGVEGGFTQQGSRGGLGGGRSRGGSRSSNGYARGGRGFSNGRGGRGGYQNSNSNYYGAGKDNNFNSGRGGPRRGGQSARASPRGEPNRGGSRGRGGNFSRPPQQ